MIRTFSFLILFIFAATGPIWILLPLAFFYSFFYGGIELIAVAVLVDGFFMPSTSMIPLYTVGSVVLLVALEFVRPYTTLYDQN